MTELNQSSIDELIVDINEISEYRLNICYKCPIYSSKYGGTCNDRLYLNKETNDVSTFYQPGYTNGCGCLLSSKVKNPSSVCPLEKW